MSTPLSGKVAVVTGSTGGIGEGIARRLAADGAAVIVSGRRVERGERVAREIMAGDGQAIFVQTDTARESDCAHLIQTTLDAFGRLDVLVNNAAHLGSVPFDDLTTEVWDQVFAVNARGPYLCCRHAIPPRLTIPSCDQAVIARKHRVLHAAFSSLAEPRDGVNLWRYPDNCSSVTSNRVVAHGCILRGSSTARVVGDQVKLRACSLGRLLTRTPERV